MTTINNSQNLIEKVGGIEKAREIAFDPLHPQMTHVSNDGRHWVNEAFAHIPEIQCQIESMIRINDLRTAIAQHYQDFEKFLTENDMPIRKSKDGYLFSNRLVYDAWVKRPELGLKKIYELKNTKIYLQGGMEAERHG